MKQIACRPKGEEVDITNMLQPLGQKKAAMINAKQGRKALTIFLIILAALIVGCSPKAEPISIFAAAGAKPAIDEVYGRVSAGGWGLWLCLAGLAISTASSVYLISAVRRQSRILLGKPLR